MLRSVLASGKTALVAAGAAVVAAAVADSTLVTTRNGRFALAGIALTTLYQGVTGKATGKAAGQAAA